MFFVESIDTSGPILVSRTGDLGCSNRGDKEPKYPFI